jgi:uncharacterized protein YcaQ
MAESTISKRTRRRFVLGKQSLYPGRRWQGKPGVDVALRAGAVVQMDPLTIVARSHDIALSGRVLDYRPALLQELRYEDRACFESGGAVMIHPIEELPYWRGVMARKQHEPHLEQFAQEHAAVLELVRQSIQSQGPQSAASFQDSPVSAGTTARRGRSARARWRTRRWITSGALANP